MPFELFDHMSDGLALFNANGNVLYANEEFKRLTRIEETEEALCLKFKELIGKLQNSKARFISESISIANAGINLTVCLYALGKKKRDPSNILVLIRQDKGVRDPTYELAEQMFNAFTSTNRLREMPLAPELAALKGENSQFRMALLEAQKAAASGFPIMIRGDSGTGKEILARAIHKLSQYSEGPFVDINCSAIPDTLIESELFGYDKGAFTSSRKAGKPGLFEEANSGSIFLDEIGDISLSAQAKILRVLEEKTFRRLGSTQNRKVDLRIISATNRNLEEMINERQFREDLYYRLNTISISLPPLRERGRDVRILADHFLQRSIKGGSKDLSFSEAALQVLERYLWPGNVRELRGVVEYAVVMTDGPEIIPQSLPSFVLQHQQTTSNHQNLLDGLSPIDEDRPLLPSILKEVERNVMMAAIKNAKNKSEALKTLGISRRAFYYKLKAYDLEKELK